MLPIQHPSCPRPPLPFIISSQGNAIMTVIEAAHLLLVIFVTCECVFYLCVLHLIQIPVKLVKQVIHRTASGSLLAQSFLSTVLLFAGIYVMEYRFMVSYVCHYRVSAAMYIHVIM